MANEIDKHNEVIIPHSKVSVTHPDIPKPEVDKDDEEVKHPKYTNNTKNIIVTPFDISCTIPETNTKNRDIIISLNDIPHDELMLLFHLFDEEDNILEHRLIPYTELISFVTTDDNSANIDVNKHLNSLGYNVGIYTYSYAFYNAIYKTTDMYVTEVSTDKEEIKLKNLKSLLPTQITDLDKYNLYTISDKLNEDIIINYMSDDEYVYLKVLDETKVVEFEHIGLFIKLNNTESDIITLRAPEESTSSLNYLRAPYFDILDDASEEVEYLNLNDLLSSVSDSDNIISQYTNTLLLAKDLEIDYSEFSNFIHFSSIVDRINRYQYKLNIKADYGDDSTEWKELFVTLDGYELYLYNELNITTADNVWFDDITDAVTYDEQNKDILYGSLPVDVITDDDNFDFVTFINVAGKYLDLIYIYIRSISSIFYKTSNPNIGIKRSLINFVLNNLSLDVNAYDSAVELNNYDETL